MEPCFYSVTHQGQLSSMSVRGRAVEPKRFQFQVDLVIHCKCLSSLLTWRRNMGQLHFQTGSWGRSKVHEWKFCENLLASVMALHLHVAPDLQYELFSAVLYSALCTFLKFLVSIRIYLERQRYGTATISEAEWIHWDSELSTAAQLATRLCTPRRLGPI